MTLSNFLQPVAVRKAVAYIVGPRGLVVFTQPDHPVAGLQVPAGTIQGTESAEEAVLREVAEETGLRDVRIVAYLGLREFDMRPFGKDEVHVRHFFQLALDDDDAPVEWEHLERHAFGLGSVPIRFNFKWMDVSEAERELIADLGASLSEVAI